MKYKVRYLHTLKVIHEHINWLNQKHFLTLNRSKNTKKKSQKASKSKAQNSATGVEKIITKLHQKKSVFSGGKN